MAFHPCGTHHFWDFGWWHFWILWIFWLRVSITVSRQVDSCIFRTRGHDVSPLMSEYVVTVFISPCQVPTANWLAFSLKLFTRQLHLVETVSAGTLDSGTRWGLDETGISSAKKKKEKRPEWPREVGTTLHQVQFRLSAMSSVQLSLFRLRW